MVADSALITLVLPLQHDVAGGAEAAQQGPVRQAKHGVLLIRGPGGMRVVDGLVLHRPVLLWHAEQLAQVRWYVQCCVKCYWVYDCRHVTARQVKRQQFWHCL